MEYTARNHNQLAPQVYQDLQRIGVKQTSRNGPVLRMPRVTTLVALCPRERVNFCGARDANPFFHLVEAMAMLAAENNVELLAYLAKNMRAYSDDGERYNAFYGSRLRETWGDQLNAVILELASKPDSRQAVAQMWDPMDLTKSTKDKACNLCLLFQVSPAGELEMTSFNRSNDAVWGILSGANVVHLSFFQEYVACALGRPVGAWTHVSNNLHVYTENPQWAGVCNAPVADYYSAPSDLGTAPLLFEGVTCRARFDAELRHFVQGCALAAKTGETGMVHALFHEAANPFIRQVAVPAFMAWAARKNGREPEVVQDWLSKIMAPDWHLACHMWVTRRAGKGGAS